MKRTHDAVVIGAGSAGLSFASGAAQLGLRVALFEAKEMGGECLNAGCVPSKALIRIASARREALDQAEFGLPLAALGSVDLPSVLSRVRGVIETIAPNDSEERFRGLGVDLRREHARLAGSGVVEAASGARLSAPLIVLATGSRPRVPHIPGLEEAGYLTNETVFEPRPLPARLAVLGAGPIGMELGQAFARLGTKVTILDAAERPLPKEDEAAAAVVQASLERDGVRFILGAKIESVERIPGRAAVIRCSLGGGAEAVEAEEILVAVGRRAGTEGLGLEAAGVEVEKGFIRTDERLVAAPGIRAIGDCNGRSLFTHSAGNQASYLVRSAVFRLPGAYDPGAVPRVTYTDPELAVAGLDEAGAVARGIRAKAIEFSFDEVDRAVAERTREGFVRVLLDPKDRILGARVVGPHAGELIGPLLIASRKRLPIGELALQVFPYPTLSEIHKRAAGAYLAPRLFSPRVRRLLAFAFGYGKGLR